MGFTGPEKILHRLRIPYTETMKEKGVCVSDGIYEFADGVAVGLGQFAELLGTATGVALGRIAVPHDGFEDIAGAAVVQAVGRGGTGAFLV